MCSLASTETDSSRAVKTRKLLIHESRISNGARHCGKVQITIGHKRACGLENCLCPVNEISCSSLLFHKILILGTFRGKKVVICHPEG